MSVNELVFSIFKPETSAAALQATRAAVTGFDKVQGTIFRSVGHVLRHNGEDVASQHRAVLGLGEHLPPKNAFLH